MGLEDKVDEKTESLVHRAITKAREYISGPNRDGMIARLKEDLRPYLTNISDEERGRRYGQLEAYLDASVAKYDTELHGIRKAATVPAGAAAFLNDVYSLVSRAPFENFAAGSYVFMGAKALAQVPAVYRYLKKTHDWYGALGAAEWAGFKTLGFLVPVIGPLLDTGRFEKIVKRRVMYEARNKFLAAIGKETETDKIKRHLKHKVGDLIDPNPAGSPAPEFALA